jgi:uncharacterized protein YbaR (Trm112 family)
MDNNYLCPFCRGNLKVKDDIIFAIRTKADQHGLIMLSPKLGNYRVRKHDDLILTEGERLETFCPMCHSNLRAISVNPNLAEVLMVDGNGDEYEIYFSEIVGEHSTFKLKDSEMESFGDDSEGYLNYFGV